LAELEKACVAIDAFNAALAVNDVDALQACFFAEQAYWKDTLALTWHLRTFKEPLQIAKRLIETKEARRCDGKWKIEGAVFVPATPVLVSTVSESIVPSQKSLVDFLRYAAIPGSVTIFQDILPTRCLQRKSSPPSHSKHNQWVGLENLDSEHRFDTSGHSSRKPVPSPLSRSMPR
jgi:hypothetical protein